MTTIAYDGKQIAVDSRMSQNNRICDDNCKKYIVRGGWVFFMCGNFALYDSFIDAFLEEKPFTKKGEIGSFAVRVIDSKVFDISYNEQYNLCEIGSIEAAGTGSDHALIAMDLGKSAVEAVKLAAKRDMYTGGVKCL